MILDMESLTLTHMVILACAALGVGLVVGAVWPRWWLLNALLVGGLFPAWTLASALFQIHRDPASNNLFPIAVAIACVITLPPAYLGAGGGEMIGRRWGAGEGP